jgi:hypothetical protein
VSPAPTIDQRFLRAYVALSAVLLLAHASLHLSWSTRSAPTPLKALVAFAGEDSLVSWTSIVTMFLLGLAALALGLVRGERGWRLTGAFFVLLSLDDGAMLHERLGWLSGVGDGRTYAWTVVVLPFIALFGLAAFAQIWRATRGHALARRRLLQAFTLWGAALALELPELALKESGERWRGFPLHLYSQLAEEWCELVAPGVLLAGLLALLGDEPRVAALLERTGQAASGPLPTTRHPHEPHP